METATIATMQDYVVAPEEITMLPLINPPAGDTRTAEEFTFDMLQTGQYYAVAAPAAPVEDTRRNWEGTPDQAIGQLADGTTIYGSFDRGGPTGIVTAEPGGWHLTAADDGYACIGHNELNITMEGVDLHDLAALREMLNSGAMEHLFAAAARWEHGEDAPPPVAPAIRHEQWQSDEGGATYTDFETGEGLTEVRIGTYGGEKPGVHLVIARECLNERNDQVITLADVRQLRDNLTTLLSEPRVSAAFGESAPPTALPPVAPRVAPSPRPAPKPTPAPTIAPPSFPRRIGAATGALAALLLDLDEEDRDLAEALLSQVEALANN